MKLEDAFLYVVLDLAVVAPGDAGRLSSELVAGGVDVIEIVCGDGVDARPALEAAAEVCRREDAIFVTGGPPGAHGIDSDGVRLARADLSLAPARAALRAAALVGLTSGSLQEAVLAVEMGPDFLVHEGGEESPAVFASLGAEAGIPLFVGGIGSLKEARRICDGRAYRLCVDGGILDLSDATGQAAAFSRILGRCM